MGAEWTIERAAEFDGTTITIASHDPIPATIRRHCASRMVVSLFASPPASHSVGRFNTGRPHSFRSIGRLMVVPSDTELEVHTGGEEWRRMIWCHFDRKHWSRSDLRWPADEAELDMLLDLKSTMITSYVRALAEEAATPGVASKTRVEGISLLVLAEIARLLDQRRRKRARGGLAPWQLQRIEALASSERHPTNSELAIVCGVSERHLMRAFQQSTGMTVGAYLRGARAGSARQLLATTDLSLKTIAHRLGFASQAGLSNFFRDHVGLTPSEYRRRMIGYTVAE